MPASSSARRALAGSAIVGALPLPIAILIATSSREPPLAACPALPLAVLAGGPSLWPEWRRLGSLILVGPAVTTLVILCAIVIGSTALWLLEGSVHRCET